MNILHSLLEYLEKNDYQGLLSSNYLSAYQQRSCFFCLSLKHSKFLIKILFDFNCVFSLSISSRLRCCEYFKSLFPFKISIASACLLLMQLLQQSQSLLSVRRNYKQQYDKLRVHEMQQNGNVGARYKMQKIQDFKGAFYKRINE